MTHLALISVATSAVPPDYSQALQQTISLRNFANKQGDHDVSLLADVTQLKILVDCERWDDAQAALKAIGEKLSLACLSGGEMSDNPDLLPKVVYPFKAAMVVYALVLGTLYYTQVGAAKNSACTLTCLHSILDQGALEKFPDGCISVSILKDFTSLPQQQQITVNRGPPLLIEVSHPRTLLQLAFLVSSVSKRDCVGRRPRRKVFAEEGILVGDREAQRAVTICKFH
jgi:hypothetical protein